MRPVGILLCSNPWQSLSYGELMRLLTNHMSSSVSFPHIHTHTYSHCLYFAFLPLQSPFPATRAGLFQEVRNWAGSVWVCICVEVFARPCSFSVSLVMSDWILCIWSQCWKTAAATCQLWEGITVIKCFAQRHMTSAQLLNWLHCLHSGDFSSVCYCSSLFLIWLLSSQSFPELWPLGPPHKGDFLLTQNAFVVIPAAMWRKNC